MKADLEVDRQPKVIHTVVATAANVADAAVLPVSVVSRPFGVNKLLSHSLCGVSFKDAGGTPLRFRGNLSSRNPRNTGWRSFLSAVHS